MVVFTLLRASDGCHKVLKSITTVSRRCSFEGWLVLVQTHCLHSRPSFLDAVPLSHSTFSLLSTEVHYGRRVFVLAATRSVGLALPLPTSARCTHTTFHVFCHNSICILSVSSVPSQHFGKVTIGTAREKKCSLPIPKTHFRDFCLCLASGGVNRHWL